MNRRGSNNSAVEFETKLNQARNQKYLLRLYVVGMTKRSKQAIGSIKEICEQHLKGRYDLEVLDVLRDPVLAVGEQIIAAPTLVKKLPLPLRKFIGDMSDTQRILVGLDLRPKVSKSVF